MGGASAQWHSRCVRPARPPAPRGAGGRDRPLVLRLDAARRSKLDEVARLRRTTASQVVRELIDSL
ncbi:hypothetical protein [Actinomyces dentalis]|uniref:hypothetical protein n=1 Tax=Actinomyces dentalis TaxID=272548 RepID=UPI000404B523|nr:hypothetical protein [Actinomyces dentalis]